MTRLATILALAVLAMLAACGGGDPDPEPVTCTVQQCLDPK